MHAVAQRAARSISPGRLVLHREIIKAHVGSLGEAAFALVEADLHPPVVLLLNLLVQLRAVGLLLLHFRRVLMRVRGETSEFLLNHLGVDWLGRTKLLGLAW